MPNTTVQWFPKCGPRGYSKGPRIRITSQQVLSLQPAVGFLSSPQIQAPCGNKFEVSENVNSFKTVMVFIIVFVIMNFSNNRAEKKITSIWMSANYLKRESSYTKWLGAAAVVLCDSTIRIRKQNVCICKS
jgi:hypothetical protein